MPAATLALVLHTLSPADKLDYLRRLHPSDARAVEAIIDDCLTHRWPKTPEDWFAVADRLSAKH